MKINLILILSLLIPAFSTAMSQEWASDDFTMGVCATNWVKMYNPRDSIPLSFLPEPEHRLTPEDRALSKEDQVWKAIDKNAPHSLKALLGEGKSPLANIRDQFGRTPLHMAAANFRSTIIPLLIAAGADVNDKKNDGQATPLIKAVNAHWFRQEDQNATVLALLALNADPSIKDIQKRNALDVARLYGSQRNFVPTLEAKMR